MKKTILIVDDEKDIRLLIRGILEDEGYSVLEAEGAKSAYALLEKEKPDLIILDIWLRDSAQDGLEILDQVKQDRPFCPVLMISGHGTIETAVSAIKRGAYDFIEKPFKADRLILMARHAIDDANLKIENKFLKEIAQISDEYIGSSSTAQSIQAFITKASDNNARVLLTGEAGTGKTVIARAIHKASNRSDKPFVSLQCQTNPSDKDFDAALSKANGGILYLDSIEKMPVSIQTKLMAALQSSSPSDVRIISSLTLRDEKPVPALSKDLETRLSLMSIEVPPLRKRIEDIPALADHFISLCSKQADLPLCSLSEAVKVTLQHMEWPGNARQLKTFLEWLLILYAGKKTEISVEDLPTLSKKTPKSQSGPDDTLSVLSSLTDSNFISLPLKEAREAFERVYLKAQMSRFSGNVSQTAQFVEMERSALHRKMKALDLLSQEKQDRNASDSTNTERKAANNA